MKKCTLFASIVCLFLLACTESSKPIMSIDQVNEEWQTTPIKGVKNAEVMDMVMAFQKQWPTQSVDALLKDLKLPEDQQQYISLYDKEHGYMSFAEGSDDRDAEDMEARVWHRVNGHQLFGINFSQPASKAKSFMVFYDYDPSTKTLTPEPNVFNAYTSSFSNTELGYELYPESNDLVANEYFFNWWGALRHVYSWDGMKFRVPETEFEGSSTLMDEYFEQFEPYEMDNFSKYALVDVDGDGEPELIVSTDNEENQAVFSIVEGEIRLIAGTDFKRQLIFYDGVVGDAGGCGTGCYYTHYTKLKNSVPEYELHNLQSYNFETDDLEDEYSKDEELLTEEEGDALLESFGEPIEPNIEWRPLKLWEED